MLSAAPLADPSLAIAASRAGGLGVLDLTYVRNERVATDAIARLAKYGTGRCGIKLDGSDESFLETLTDELPDAFTTAILSPADAGRLPGQVHALRRRDLRILLETISVEEARLGEEVGVHGLIAKGHEAGGRVGEESTSILLQRLVGETKLPVFAQGGIGLHTAAACHAAGAAGVVLDAQLLLTRESLLPEETKATIRRMDGSETTCVGAELGEAVRVYARPNLSGLEDLRNASRALSQDGKARAEVVDAWREEVRTRIGWESPDRVWPIAQDAAFASALAERFLTVGGVLGAVRESVESHVRTASSRRPLDEGSPLARSHGTRYPIVQGPMTRVSDRPAFAARVAEAGGLPFLALALLRGGEVETLLEETARTLGDRPWGVGILGFVPLDLREEQLEVIRSYRPAFALIAGGRPDQALSLEREGIPTYLHVPSPGLLELFLESGARRFVFEGRECGGHVGPRPSFVLWNTMIETVLQSLSPEELGDLHVLFAGGIHDARSASMVGAAAAPLAEQGAKVGALLGTAYLFTDEAVESGAVVKGMQDVAARCESTVLLETGPGHSTRCALTPYATTFERERQRLIAERRSEEEIRDALEELNLGRLRVATKGVARHPAYGRDPEAPKLTTVSEEEQEAEGMYMLGQVAALRGASLPMADLHRDVAVGSSELLADLAEPARPDLRVRREEQPSDVAIVGMGCLLPKASDLETYWQNIEAKVDAVTEVPADRWDVRRYFDPDPKAPDKTYSRWGGFLDEVPFDPLRYGIPPSSMRSIEPLQLLTLEVVREALRDAGYAERDFPRERASVVLGVGGGVADLGQHYALRSGLPLVLDEVPESILSRLPEWTEDAFPGILLNVAAGRVANRFDFGGVNYTVDAACASSLAAVQLAARELEAGTSDMVIAGGADTVQNPFGYLAFSKTQALSPTGRCRTFDEEADGIAISEGIAVVVLKRLADAERDGDRIYAVIKSVAGSSDGRAQGLTAPRPEGQVLALERAYAKARFSPATVTLIEAHGTGTVVGDRAEVETLKRVFEAAGASSRGCAIGSVKSMIGHTKCTAGVAGMIKVAKALHHKVLPPTINVETPNSRAGFPESPFYLNTDARPWLSNGERHPRRAGVSAFGFGGTNFHAVLEEYEGDFLAPEARAASSRWPSELILVDGESREELAARAESIERAIARGARPELRDLAYSSWRSAGGRSGSRLALVATSLDDLREKLGSAAKVLRAAEPAEISEPRGIYFAPDQPLREAKVAFLFPGQGSQHPNMLRELALHFPEVRGAFERADQSLRERLPEGLSSYIFPPSAFTPEEERAAEQSLTQTHIAQPALGAASMAMVHLLDELGIRPHMAAGHSYGEYVALCTAGVLSEEALYPLSEARGRCISEAAGDDLGAMAAVAEGPERVKSVLESCEGVWVANLNAPRQTVISGTREGLERAAELLAREGIQARPLRVACAFHSPVVSGARDRLAGVLSKLDLGRPDLPVFSNTTAAPYPAEPGDIEALLAEHLVSPVRFAPEVEAMYEAEARAFVEVGPGGVLTGLVGQVLEGRPHLAVITDAAGRSGLTQLNLALAQLAAQGVPVNLDRLYAGRPVQLLDLGRLEAQTRSEVPSTTWLVTGGRASPLPRAAADPESPGPVARPADDGPAQVPAADSDKATADAALPGTDGRAADDGAAQLSTPPAEAFGGLAREPGPGPAEAYGPPPGQDARAADDGTTPFPTTGPDQAAGTDRRGETSREVLIEASMPPSPAALPGDAAGQVMLGFQRVMSRFLEAQRQVLTTYLKGMEGEESRRSEPSPSTATEASSQAEWAELLPAGDREEPAAANRAVSSQAGSPHAAPDQAVSAQVSPDQAASSPAAPGEAVSPQIGSWAGPDQISAKLVEIVAERTGYPPEMLDPNLDMTADLGIDSIKRVEVLGAFLRA
ncbi:MAG: acyltransferase domain-containing protein, partial [Actinomycetota bacterium]|nr:acyltransferase domain-containing protein [Actinomycetota bacterium]